MRAKLLVLLGILLCQPFNSYANNEDAHSADQSALASVPDAAEVGRGVLTYAFWDVYEATLYAPAGKWDAAQPFALSIEYYRALNGKAIADRSVQEMRKQGFSDEVTLAAWHTQMKAIFPDVSAGTVLTAVYEPGKQTRFYDHSKAIGTVKGDDFGKWFFGIWLAEKTSEPKLRRALLGLQ